MDAEHLPWITTRAAGIVLLLASSAAVAVGLLIGSRVGRGRTAQLRVAHEALSLAAIAALAIHVGALLLDGFIGFGVADVTIPFVAGYQRVWTSAGIVAGWSTLVLGLSYYARGRIGPARWRRLHRWIAVAWILGVVHGLMEGTDAGAPWFLLTVAAAVLPPFALLAARHAAAPREEATA